MDWFFCRNGEQHGPLSEQEFRGLIEQGTVKSDTQVWRAGMADWCAAGSVPGLFAPPPLPQSPPSPKTPPPVEATASPSDRVDETDQGRARGGPARPRKMADDYRGFLVWILMFFLVLPVGFAIIQLIPEGVTDRGGIINAALLGGILTALMATGIGAFNALPDSTAKKRIAQIIGDILSAGRRDA